LAAQSCPMAATLPSLSALSSAACSDCTQRRARRPHVRLRTTFRRRRRCRSGRSIRPG
jgi:hypothetical protein